MDHRPKCNNKNFKTFRRKHRVNLHNLVLGKAFLGMTPKAQATMTKIEIKTFGAINTIMKKVKGQPTEQQKKSRTTYLIKNLYPRYIKDS